MIKLRCKGRFCYVENDDCYILYYLFKYRFNNNKCCFNRKFLNKVLKVLYMNEVSFVCGEVSYVDFNSKYNFYLELGKKKFELDNYLVDLENKLLDIVLDRNFNKIYQRIIRLV